MTDAAVVLLMVSLPGRDDAERLGEQLVEERLAGAGSVVPGIHSFSWSQGRLQREHESLLLLRTTGELSAAAQARILELHGGEPADLIEIPVSAVSPAYLAYLAQAVDSTRGERASSAGSPSDPEPGG
ncbi:MAG TPA: divalent-cation tolerance protein CutA [Candidatus Nitrosotalea sp.]|nr:divalent-cation tolerance protein CutA [Candidatus Nitrosotalea sp.]